MVLTNFTILLYFNIGFIVVGLLFLLIKNWSNIMSFLYPNKYNYICMLELDNSVSEWIQKKSNDLTFKFNEGIYNMFTKNQEGKQDNKTLYRSGNIGMFFYIEGIEDPIDYRNIKVDANPQLKNQLLKVNMAKLWSKEENLGSELLGKFGFWILIIIGFMLIVIVFKVFGTKGG